jgi:chromosome partitioning protein
MKVITIGQRKGGNGKSTSALNLAHAFALRGKRVLLIDLDDQKNTTSAIETAGPAALTVGELLVDPTVSIEAAAVATGWPGVSLIAASRSLSGVLRELDAETGGHYILREKLASGDDLYDFCLIDTSPSMNTLVLNALCASNYLFIPLSSKFFSLQGLGQTMDAYQKVKKRLNEYLSVVGMAFVIHDGRSSLANQVTQKAREEFPELVLSSMVNQNTKIEQAQVYRQSIFAYAHDDRGAVQYAALADELLLRMGD